MFFYIYRVYSIFLLSFLYRPLLYNFIDQKYTKRLFLLAIPYGLIISLVAPNFTFSGHSYFPKLGSESDDLFIISKASLIPDFYDNLRELRHKNKPDYKRKPINYFSLSSHELNSDLATIFLKSIKGRDEQYFKKEWPLLQPFLKKGIQHDVIPIGSAETIYQDSLNELLENEKAEFIEFIKQRRTEIREANDSIMLMSYIFNNSYRVDSINRIEEKYKTKIDSFERENVFEVKDALKGLFNIQVDSLAFNDKLDCQFYEHPNLGEKGLLCYFSTKELENGKHLLQFYRRGSRGFEIPFWVNRNSRE